jgi:hypothetical protein
MFSSTRLWQDVSEELQPSTLFAQENSNLTQSPLFFMAIFSPTLLCGLNASIADGSVAIEAINVASDGAINVTSDCAEKLWRSETCGEDSSTGVSSHDFYDYRLIFFSFSPSFVIL